MSPRRTSVLVVLAVVGALGFAACGSADSGDTKKNNTVAAGKPIKLGVLTSVTGAAASGFTTVEDGVKARLALENSKGGVDGHKLEYVVADDQSSGTGAVAAAKKLIQQEKVYGILENSSFFSAAAATTTKAGIPVTGVSFDAGPEWFDKASTNIFDSFGYDNYSIVSSTFGQYFKDQGATKVGAVGYSTSPSSSLAAIAAVKSAQAAGLKPGLLNNSVPFGGTDVGPIVQAIKSSGTDALYLPVVPNTAFAIVQGLKQAGVTLKSVLLATGYGGDLLKSPAATAAAEGLDFATVGAPVELNTAATQEFSDALKKYAGYDSVPTFGQYIGWFTADLFISGLKLSGGDASSKTFIEKLRQSTWDGANGLTDPINFADIQPAGAGQTNKNCVYVSRLTDGKFVPQPDAQPICGKILPGVKASL